MAEFDPRPWLRSSLGLLLLAVGQRPLCGDDWPQWRGPQRDGVWRESGVVETIPESGLPIRWRARVKNGWSGPAVAEGRVFVTDHDYRSNPEVERVLCFDEATGEWLWSHEYPCPYGNMEYGNGPRATPTVHAELVYTLGTMGHLVCLVAETGAVVWKHDPQDLDVEMPRYGVSAAPLVVGDVLIVTLGARPQGTAMGFDRLTGAERWRALEDRPAYSAPIVVERGGQRQVILWTGDNVNGLDPATGQLLWQVPYKAAFDPAQATATPVVRGDKMLCLAAWNRGSMMLQLDGEKPGATVLWKTRSEPTASSSTPVFQDDAHIYTIVGDGALCCLDPATGEEIWRTREPTSERFGMAHLVSRGDDRCWLLNQQGHLIAARLTAEGYRESGRMLLVEPTAGYRAAGPVCWAHPAFANRHVFARNDRELVCVSLAAEEAVSNPAVEATRWQATPLPEATPGETHQTLSVSVSPDGGTLAIATGWGLVKQVDLATGAALPGPARHNDWVCAVNYSTDGKHLVSAGGSEFTPQRNGGTTSAEIKVWDRQAGAERGKLSGHTNKVFGAAFSPDGATLATGAADRTIRLWDVAALRESRVLEGHTDAVSSLAWSQDGRTLASASWDRTVRLWNAATGEELATLSGSEEEVLCVAISPDGNWLAAGGSDRNVRVWNVASRELAATLSGHRGTVHAAAFSPDGATLATGSGDETIRLWNLATRAATDVLRGHRSSVTCLAFTRDGRQLVSGALDGPVRTWTAGP
jgi:WD40 repeat protein